MRPLDTPTRKLPKFDGKPNSVVDWKAFIVQFERLALRHHRDVVECLDNLIDWCFRNTLKMSLKIFKNSLIFLKL